MRSSIDMVREFQLAYDCVTQTSPQIPNLGTCLLRMQLCQEECAEFTHALAARDLVEALDALTDLQYVLDGTVLACGMAQGWCDRLDVGADLAQEPGMPPAALRLCTVIGLTIGKVGVHLDMGDVYGVRVALNLFQEALDEAFSACGLSGVRRKAFEEVHRSNMSKMGEDGLPVVNAAGRVVKGPNYSPPDLLSVLM